MAYLSDEWKFDELLSIYGKFSDDMTVFRDVKPSNNVEKCEGVKQFLLAILTNILPMMPKINVKWTVD